MRFNFDVELYLKKHPSVEAHRYHWEKDYTDTDIATRRAMEKGCKLVIFIEFVPVTEEAQHLAPGLKERAYMEKAMEELREHYQEAVLLSFPGDELAMGGCMAAGREFFHINSHGGAEPCPFSPYSDVNIRDTSLKDAIQSPLFQNLKDGGFLNDEHEGGCVLFTKRDQVEALMRNGQ